MSTRTHRRKSDAALEAALAAIGPCHARTSALLLFFAAARLLSDVYDAPTASELAYMAADGMATKGALGLDTASEDRTRP